MKTVTLLFVSEEKKSLNPLANSHLAKLITSHAENIINEQYTIYIKKVEDYNADDINPIFVFELLRVEFTTVVSEFEDTTIDLLKKYNIPILLFFDSEGFDFEKFNFWLDSIQCQFTDNGLQDNKKFLIYGTAYIQEHYDKHNKRFSNIDNIKGLNSDYLNKDFFIKSHQSKMTRCFGSNFYEYFHLHYPLATDYVVNKPEALNAYNKNKDFLCFNRNLRYHRLALVSELYRNNLNRSGVISLIGSDIMPYPENSQLIKAEKIFLKDQDKIDHFRSFYENFSPIKIKKDTKNLWTPDNNLYKKTFFSLVTETEITSKCFQVSEKTMKAIVFMHPFIVFGNPCTLKFLRSMGYKTFPEFFDESYDEEEDESKRFDMIMEQVKNFVSLPVSKKIKKFNQVKKKLLENRKTWEHRWENRFKPILKTFDKIIEDINNV